MSGDYSKQRSDPSVDFAGVLMQQGRVQLDANWSEFIALHGRRLRAATDVVYFEAWQREVTDLEEPELVEAAVGVDTDNPPCRPCGMYACFQT